jgi:DNA-binding NarL/FixJ family response regulator
MKTINIAIVEDNQDIRTGLVELLNASPELTCKYEFSNAEDAVHRLPELQVDVVLMDINLPGISGIEALQLLKDKCDNTLFVMLTVYEDDDNIFKSLEAGASGYLLKNTPAEKIIESIKEVVQGGSPMNAQIARKVVQFFQQQGARKMKHAEELSKREMELLVLLSKGYRYKEIAEKLFISRDTVRTHIRNIYVKLQVNSKIEAINKVFT